MERLLNHYEHRVWVVLKNSIRALNINEVARKSNLNWATAKKYLEILTNKVIVEYKFLGNKKYYKLNKFFRKL